MGIVDWLRRVTSGGEEHLLDEDAAPIFATGEEIFHGLNMKDAIDAHDRWKIRLQSQLEGWADETMDATIVSADNHCVLGKWIYTEGIRKFGALPEFEELIKVHAEFHLAAGDILLESQRGAKEQGLDMLGSRDYRYKSAKVQLALVRLYTKAKC